MTLTTASSESPRSAAAPPIFSAITVAPTPRRPAVYSESCDCDVVVDHDRLDLDAVVGSLVGGHLEVEDVTGVVLDDVDDARSTVHSLGGGEHLVRHRRCEHLARAGRVEHALADEAAVQRLVARAAARDQRDLALDRRIRPDQDLIRDVIPEDVRNGGSEPGERLFDHLVRLVDDFPHAPGGCGHGSTLL